MTQNWSFFSLNYKHYVRIRGSLIITVRKGMFHANFTFGNESSRGRKFLGTKVPGNESSTYGTFVPGNENSRVRKFHESENPRWPPMPIEITVSSYLNGKSIHVIFNIFGVKECIKTHAIALIRSISKLTRKAQRECKPPSLSCQFFLCDHQMPAPFPPKSNQL